MELALRGETLSRLSLSYTSMATNAGQGSGIKYVFPWCRNNATWSTLLEYPTLPTVRKKASGLGLGWRHILGHIMSHFSTFAFQCNQTVTRSKTCRFPLNIFVVPFPIEPVARLRCVVRVQCCRRNGNKWHQRGSDSVISIYSFVLFIIHKRARSLKKGNNAGSERKE